MKKLFTVFLFLVLSQIAVSQTGWTPEPKFTAGELITLDYAKIGSIDDYYYCAEFNRIYRKVNNGNWDTIYTNLSWTISDLCFNANSTNHEIMAVGSGGNVLKIPYYGYNPSYLQNVDSVYFNKIIQYGTNNYLTVGRSGKIYQSTNYGSNWVAWTSPTTSDLVDVAYDDGVIYALSNTEIYKTISYGANWITYSLPSNGNSVKSFCIINSNTWLLAKSGGASGYNYRTTDAGANWTSFSVPGYNYYLKALSYNSLNSKTYASGISGAIFYSSDNGLNWSRQFSGAGSNLNDISSAGMFCVGSSGTALLGRNGGFDWDVKSQLPASSLSSVSFSSSNPSIGWAFNNNSAGLYRTMDKGISWQKLDSNTIYKSMFVEPDNKLYALSSFSTQFNIRRSTDFGTTWSMVYSGGFNSPNKLMVFHPVYFVSNFDYLYKSADGGNNFTQYPLSQNYLLNGISDFYFMSVSPDYYGWVVGYSNKIVKTTNSGINWTAVNTTVDTAYTSVTFLDALTGIATGISGKIARTTDGGNYWYQVGSYSSKLNKVCFLDNSKYGWIVGRNGTILQTTNSGANWFYNYVNSSQDFYSVYFPTGSQGYAVGNSGTVFYKSYNNIPVLINPYNGYTNGGLNQSFTWSAVTGYGSGKYNFIISTDSLFQNIVDTVTVYNNNYNPYIKLTFNNKYWWKVRSLTDFGFSSFSDARSFSTMKPWFVEKINLYNWAGYTGDSLFIGMDSRATDSLDPVYGEYILPPPPPAGILDVRFNLPSNPVKNTKKDLRSDADSMHIWSFEVRPFSNPTPYCYISWDSANLPMGSFILKDLLKDSSVNMKKQSSYSTWLQTSVFPYQIIYYKMQSLDKIVMDKWNLVSMPYRALDMRVDNLFSGHTGNTFGFNSSTGSYYTVDTLKNSTGYWVYFDASKTVSLTGYVLNSDTVVIPSGWSLIGPYGNISPVELITTTPPGILQSFFFGYNGGYEVSSYLKPGYGYWINSSAPGKIVLGHATDNMTAIKIQDETSGFVKFTVSDNANRKTDLFLARENQITKSYIMPPLPPEGIFDARFATDKCVESMSLKSIQVNITSAQKPVKIKLSNAKEYKFRIKDAVTGKIVNAEISDGGEITINENIDKLIIYNDNNLIPDTYDLAQNYPNPFNPVTTIKYQIPKSGLVTIKIFDVLGREVKSLVNEKKDAGYYSIKFDASTLASGIYFYRLISGTYTSVKKMAVIK